MRYLLAAAAVVTSVAAAGLFVSMSDSNAEADTQLVTKFNAATLKKAIADAGAEYVDTRTSEQGREIVIYRAGERSYFIAILCGEDKSACKGIELVATFNSKGVNISMDTVNTYNLQQISGKAIFVPSIPSLDNARFVSAVGGITHANLVWEIQNFHATTNALIEVVRDATLTASTGVPTRPVVYAPQGAQRGQPTHTVLPAINNLR
jgi:hypothetical protein